MRPPIEFFFAGWTPVARIAFIGAASYLAIIVLLRLTGARTLAMLTPFDVVIMITLGSAFGRVLTAREVAFVEALTAFVVLIGMQVLFSWLRARYPGSVRLLAPSPALLYYRGTFLRDMMARERVAELDLVSAIREHGVGSLDEVEAIVLESSGRLSVIPTRNAGDRAALDGLSGATRGAAGEVREGAV